MKKFLSMLVVAMFVSAGAIGCNSSTSTGTTVKESKTETKVDGKTVDSKTKTDVKAEKPEGSK